MKTLTVCVAGFACIAGTTAFLGCPVEQDYLRPLEPVSKDPSPQTGTRKFKKLAEASTLNPALRTPEVIDGLGSLLVRVLNWIVIGLFRNSSILPNSRVPLSRLSSP